MKRFLPLFVFTALAIALAAALLLQPAREQAALTGKAEHTPLPILKLFTHDNVPVVIEPESVAGQVTLIDFFASWCTACAQDHRTLLGLAQRGDKPLMIGIAWNDTPARIDDWLAQHRDPYARVLFDSDGKAAIALGVRGLPESFLVDKHGAVRYHLTGPMTPEIYAQVIRPRIYALQEEP